MQLNGITEVIIPGNRVRVENTGSNPLFLLAGGFQPVNDSERVGGWIVQSGGKVELHGTNLMFTDHLTRQRGKLILYPIGSAEGTAEISEF